MRFTQSWLAIGTVVVAMALPNSNSWAKSSLESRVERVETMLESQLKQRDPGEIDNLRQQLQELRGIVEEYQHNIEILQKQNDDLYKQIGAKSAQTAVQGITSQQQTQIQTVEAQQKDQAQPIPTQATKARAIRSANANAEAKEVGQNVGINNSSNNLTINNKGSNLISSTTDPMSADSSLEVVNSTSISSTVTAAGSTAVAENSTAAVADTAAVNKLSEQEKYDAAYKLIEAKKYADAQTLLQDFMWQYPDSKYVANVHYWLGEIYLSYWHADKSDHLQVEKALSAFKTVVAKYPQHNKNVDCLLKIGLTEAERENWAAAKEYLSTVTNKYPESSRAKIASMRLEAMHEQGLI